MSFSVNSIASTAGLTMSRSSTARAVEAAPTDNLMSFLTPSDREIVFQATGYRLDEDSKLVSMFAVSIALDRKSGYLSAGQDISSVYLQDMATTYAAKQYEQSYGVATSKALSYLATLAPRTGIDVTV